MHDIFRCNVVKLFIYLIKPNHIYLKHFKRTYLNLEWCFQMRLLFIVQLCTMKFTPIGRQIQTTCSCYIILLGYFCNMIILTQSKVWRTSNGIIRCYQSVALNVKYHLRQLSFQPASTEVGYLQISSSKNFHSHELKEMIDSTSVLNQYLRFNHNWKADSFNRNLCSVCPNLFE